MPDDPRKLSSAYIGARSALGAVLALLLVVVGSVGVFVEDDERLVLGGVALLGIVCGAACLWALRLAKQGRARVVNPPK